MGRRVLLRPGRAAYAPAVTDATPDRTSWHVRRLFLDPDSFVPVLLLAVVCMVLFPFSDNYRLGALIVYPFSAALLVIALHHSRVHWRLMRAAVVILVVVGVGTLLSSIARVLEVGQERHMVATASFLYALLFAVAFPAIVRRAFQHRNVNLNTLAAGISAYLIIGLWYAALYRGMAFIEGSGFFAQSGPLRPGDFVYFSFITLTTVGYGDMSPLSNAARSTAVTEAVLGQIFLVTAVARIVSLLGSRRPEPEGSTSPPDTDDDTGAPDDTQAEDGHRR